ncbi:MAG: DUF3575 domain-containing protein [Bacteroidia bacterium]
MYRYYLLAWLVVPIFVLAQPKTDLGINVTPLAVGTVDFQGGMKLNPSFWLQFSGGFRAQSKKSSDPLRTRFLESYSQLKNYGAFLSIGGRLVNPLEDEYEFPFIGFHLTGVYYNETLTPDDPSGGLPPRNVQGIKLGLSTTIGFSLRINPRLYADLAIQMGYSKPRNDLLAYYLPGMGYSTFGYGFIGVKGGHIQPIIAFKYTIVRDRREVIRDKE